MKVQIVTFASILAMAELAVAEIDDGSAGIRPPAIAASYARQGAAQFKRLGSDSSIAAEEYQVYASLMRFDVGHASIDLEIDYQYTHYDYDNVNSRDRDLHRLQLPIRVTSESGNWQFDAYLAPGVATSSNMFKNCVSRCSRDDLWASGRFEAGRRKGSSTWLLGVAHDRSFGEPSVYPIVGIRLEPSDALTIRLAFPQSGFEYAWSDRQSLQAWIFPAGHQWRVVADDFMSEFDYRVKGVRSQLTWNYRIWWQVSIDVSASYEFGRKHWFADNQGLPLQSDVADQWGVAIGFRFGPAVLPRTHGGHL